MKPARMLSSDETPVVFGALSRGTVSGEDIEDSEPGTAGITANLSMSIER